MSISGLADGASLLEWSSMYGADFVLGTWPVSVRSIFCYITGMISSTTLFLSSIYQHLTEVLGPGGQLVVD